MWSKVNFGQKDRWQPFCKKFQKKNNCVSIWNGQKCDRKWISDIQNGRRRPFYTKKIVFIWNGQKCGRKWFSDIKMAAGTHFVKQIHKIKLWYWSEMIRNAIQSDFLTSKMATGGHFKKHLQKKLREWFEQCSNRLLADYNLI